MNPRSPVLFFTDIIESIEKIEAYIKDLDYEDFTGNNMAVDAVLRNLEIIGEAARNIPDDIKERYSDVPWKRIIGLRNIVAHVYFGIDTENIWVIITKNLPDTKPMITKILTELHED